MSFNSTETPGKHTAVPPLVEPGNAERARKPWSTPSIIRSELSQTAAHVTRFTDGSRAGISYGS